MAAAVVLGEGYVVSATQQDIEAYAEFLGMNLEEDKEYLWIAEAGLRSAVPAPWLMCRETDVAAESGRAEVFFFNNETGESTWDHPCDAHFKRMFFTEKARNMPCVVVTLHAARAESGAVEVSAIGMAGDTLAKIAVTSSHETVLRFGRRLRKELGGKIRMILSDGKVLAKSQKDALVGELFGFEIPDESSMSDGQGDNESNAGTRGS